MTQEQNSTLRQWIELFAGCNGYDESGNLNRTVEIRVLQDKDTYSGYFKNVDNILQTIQQYDGKGGMIYAPFNKINSACYSRAQCEKMMKKPKETTSDGDIVGRDFILIDIDPVRPAGVNSTEEEKSHAIEAGRKIYSFLVDKNGFEKPIVADSGNGLHLYFRVQLHNGEEEKELVNRFLKTLGMYFSDEKIDVDLSVGNAARMAKIIGTTSCKGSNTTERPARISKFLSVPNEVKVTDVSYITKIAEMYPKPETPTRENNYRSERFDIESFIQDHGIKVSKTTTLKEGTRYVLEECPFNPNHKNAALFINNSGAIGFKCFHNSCSQYTFRDFRLHYDPEAYSRATRQAVSNWNRFQHPRPQNQPETEDKGPKWLSMSQIQDEDLSNEPSIPTGCRDLDRKIHGLFLGQISVLSGINGSGKSVWIDNIIANAIQAGYKCAVWSGELTKKRFRRWLNQVLAGKNHTIKEEGFDGSYYVRKNVASKIDDWLKDKFWLYNNAYGNNWTQLYDDIDIVVTMGAKLLILDNLSALDLDSNNENYFRLQSKLVETLAAYAKQKNIHIILVCHPRKEMDFLRKESISGSGDLSNLVDNVFIIHRVGIDFRKRAEAFLGSRKVDELIEEKHFDNVIEICKNRSFGEEGFVGMYFEKESRRMKNTPEEFIVYGWDEQPVQQTISDMTPVENQSFNYDNEQEEEEWSAWYHK